MFVRLLTSVFVRLLASVFVRLLTSVVVCLFVFARGRAFHLVSHIQFMCTDIKAAASTNRGGAWHSALSRPCVVLMDFLSP